MTTRKIFRFNRKTFDPKGNRDHSRILSYLRNCGFTRTCHYRAFTEKDYGFYRRETLKLERLRSTAYKHVYKGKKGRVFLDAGCGYSPDAKIAMEHDGFKEAYRIDLFPYPKRSEEVKDLIGDIAEPIKLPSKSIDVIVCQAVLDLMEADDRDKFYKNAHRLLKKGGLLSIYLVRLSCGWGFEGTDEKKSVKEAGFEIIKSFGTGFVAKKI